MGRHRVWEEETARQGKFGRREAYHQIITTSRSRSNLEPATPAYYYCVGLALPPVPWQPGGAARAALPHTTYFVWNNSFPEPRAA